MVVVGLRHARPEVAVEPSGGEQRGNNCQVPSHQILEKKKNENIIYKTCTVPLHISLSFFQTTINILNPFCGARILRHRTSYPFLTQFSGYGSSPNLISINPLKYMVPNSSEVSVKYRNGTYIDFPVLNPFQCLIFSPGC